MGTLITSDLDYDSVIDKVISLADGLQLLIASKFSRKDKDKRRLSYVTEWQYESTFSDRATGTSIRRENTVANIILRCYRDGEVRRDLDLTITIQDLFMFRKTITDILECCLYSDIFYIDKKSNELCVRKSKRFDFISAAFGNFRSVAFEPVVIVYNNEIRNKGVRYHVDDNGYYDIPIENFSALYSVIIDINLYTVFQNHANFLAAWKKENYNKCLIQISSTANKMKTNHFDEEAANNTREGDVNDVNQNRMATGHIVKAIGSNNKPGLDDM